MSEDVTHDEQSLKDMPLEELWQLFPITLADHDLTWKRWFEDESELLRSLIPEAVRISHIGSTAICTIKAKPIVDILVEMPLEANLIAMALHLEQNGYIIMNESKSRILLNKGYTFEGYAERVFHIHLRFIGDNDELYFRDYLLAHPDIAQDYEQLKLRLLNECGKNRDAYTDAKGDFVDRCITEAKKEASVCRETIF